MNDAPRIDDPKPAPTGEQAQEDGIQITAAAHDLLNRIHLVLSHYQPVDQAAGAAGAAHIDPVRGLYREAGLDPDAVDEVMAIDVMETLNRVVEAGFERMQAAAHGRPIQGPDPMAQALAGEARTWFILGLQFGRNLDEPAGGSTT